MATDVLGKSLHTDINSVRKRIEVHTRRPGIVENDQSSRAMRSFTNRRHVLHFHGDRPRRLGPDKTGMAVYERLDMSTNIGVIESDVHSEALKKSPGEVAVGPVNTVGHEDVIA